MKIDTVFIGNGTLRSILIPESQCIKAPFSLSPDIPQRTLDAIASKMASMFEPAGDVIVRPHGDGMYEVLCGWHEIVLWRALHPEKHIPVKSGNLSDNEAIALVIRAPYESSSLGCNKIWLSRAVRKSKKHFKLTDKALSAALGDGYSRSMINFLVNLSKLSPDSEKRYVDGMINSSQLKHLCTLSFSQQAQFIDEKSKNTRRVNTNNISTLDPDDPFNIAQAEFSESAGIDEKRFARDIAERLGAPTRLLTSANGQQRLEIECYDFSELAGIADKLSTSPDKMKGKLIFDVNQAGDFTPIINALFDDEL